MIVGEAWGPVLGVQASEGHILIGEGSKRGRGEFEPKSLVITLLLINRIFLLLAILVDFFYPWLA